MSRPATNTTADIYQNPRITKSDVYLFSSIGGTSLNVFNAIDKDQHLRKRKIVSPAISEKSMIVFEPAILEQVKIFLKLLKDSCAEPINMSPMCKRLAMEVAVRLGFGTNLDFQTDRSHDFIPTGISISNIRINVYMQFPFLSKLHLDEPMKRTSLRRRWRSTVERMIKSRLSESPDAKHDLYSFVNGSWSSDADTMQNSELFGESLFFLSAGE
jgi:cytochrome P450